MSSLVILFALCVVAALAVLLVVIQPGQSGFDDAEHKGRGPKLH